MEGGYAEIKNGKRWSPCVIRKEHHPAVLAGVQVSSIIITLWRKRSPLFVRPQREGDKEWGKVVGDLEKIRKTTAAAERQPRLLRLLHDVARQCPTSTPR